MKSMIDSETSSESIIKYNHFFSLRALREINNTNVSIKLIIKDNGGDSL